MTLIIYRWDTPPPSLTGPPSSYTYMHYPSGGMTPQYSELQQLQEKYGPKGFTVLAFPCNQFGVGGCKCALI